MKTFHKTENFYHSFQPSCRMNYAEKKNNKKLQFGNWERSLHALLKTKISLLIF